MKNLKNMNIWKSEEKKGENQEQFLRMDISDLGLSVRSFNCLKRANFNTVRDILAYIDKEGNSLRNIRNLGVRSENEILSKLEEYKMILAEQTHYPQQKKAHIIRPAKRVWDREVEEFQLPVASVNRLKSCGIIKVGDLYAAQVKREPGWYDVRELFDKISNFR